MILTLDDLRQNYGMNFPVSDPQYVALLETAEEECISYADIEFGNVVEYFPSGKALTLTHLPVKVIKSVTCNDSPISYRYEKRSHQVILSTECNTEVVVEYECGFETVPAILKAAVALTVQHLSKLQSSKQMGVLSRSTEGGTEQIEQSIPPIAVKSLLNKYRSMIL